MKRTPMPKRTKGLTRAQIHTRHDRQRRRTQRYTGPSRDVRLVVLQRDGYRCVRCGVDVRGMPYSLQHRRARGMGGSGRPDTNEPANLITVCGTATSAGHCHVDIESNPVDAAARGWRVAQGRDPAEVPVWTYLRGWIRIDNGGGYVAAETGSAA